MAFVAPIPAANDFATCINPTGDIVGLTETIASVSQTNNAGSSGYSVPAYAVVTDNITLSDNNSTVVSHKSWNVVQMVPPAAYAGTGTQSQIGVTKWTVG